MFLKLIWLLTGFGFLGLWRWPRTSKHERDGCYLVSATPISLCGEKRFNAVAKDMKYYSIPDDILKEETDVFSVIISHHLEGSFFNDRKVFIGSSSSIEDARNEVIRLSGMSKHPAIFCLTDKDGYESLNKGYQDCHFICISGGNISHTVKSLREKKRRGEAMEVVNGFLETSCMSVKEKDLPDDFQCESCDEPIAWDWVTKDQECGSCGASLPSQVFDYTKTLDLYLEKGKLKAFYKSQ